MKQFIKSLVDRLLVERIAQRTAQQPPNSARAAQALANAAEEFAKEADRLRRDRYVVLGTALALSLVLVALGWGTTANGYEIIKSLEERTLPLDPAGFAPELDYHYEFSDAELEPGLAVRSHGQARQPITARRRYSLRSASIQKRGAVSCLAQLSSRCFYV